MYSLGAIATAGAASGPAAPVVMALAAAVQPLTQIITNMVKGCGQSCIDASNYADTAETYIKEMLATYFSRPDRCVADKQAALDYIDGVLRWLDSGCRAVGGAAGARCISERLVRGGTAPWCPKPGGRGCDWITLYRDPLAADAPAGCSLGGDLGSLVGGIGGSGGSGWVWIVVIVLAVLAVMKGKG